MFFFFFLTNIQFFASQDINWLPGVVWITCGLLWCFYQLFGLSFWRHPFTAEDPLVSNWHNATFLQICLDEETNSSTSCMIWEWANFQQIFIFGWTFPLLVAPIDIFRAMNNSFCLKCNKSFSKPYETTMNTKCTCLRTCHIWDF